MMRTISLLFAVVFLALAGCAGSPPVHYYALESTPLESMTVPAAVPGQRESVIGVGSISLPAYLDRLPIVQRNGAALHFDEAERWGEPLADAVPRVLAANLAAQLPGQRIVQQPWSRTAQPDWKLTVRVDRFEAVEGNVVLQASWSVQDREGKLVANRGLQLSQPCEGRDTIALVKAHSQALAEFSAALADDIRRLPRQ